jgi:hypothetical protein
MGGTWPPGKAQHVQGLEGKAGELCGSARSEQREGEHAHETERVHERACAHAGTRAVGRRTEGRVRACSAAACSRRFLSPKINQPT